MIGLEEEELFKKNIALSKIYFFSFYFILFIYFWTIYIVNQASSFIKRYYFNKTIRFHASETVIILFNMTILW